MKIAVTTASGQLGRAIVEEAAAQLGKENIIGIARRPDKCADLGVEIRKGDYNNADDFVTAFQGVEVALVVSSFAVPEERIGQHRNVIAGAKEAGVRKIIYTSIFGHEGKCAFDVIIKSNRQTEEDVKASGLDWIIGRNGLYIEPDFKSIPDYRKAGKIANCGGDGKCAYTSRTELAFVYAHLMVDDTHNGSIYNLCGAPVTQQELVEVINSVFGESLIYESMSVEDYVQDRINAHGEFLGKIIGGIYQGIREGAFDIPSDFKEAAGSEHLTLREMAEQFK